MLGFILSPIKARGVVLSLFLWAVIFGLSGCQQAKDLKLQGQTMGTVWHANIRQVPHDLPSFDLQQRLEIDLININRVFSTYDSSSELSRFNAKQSLDCQPISAQLYQVLKLAQRIAEETAGAFDITIAPALKLWGFGAGTSPLQQPPSDEEIEAVQQLMSYQLIKLKDEDGRYCAQKLHPLVTADLSAIAKGYGADLLAQALGSYQLQGFLVEIGGEIRTKHTVGRLWSIGIEQPLADGRRAVQTGIDIANVGIATSGDYRNYQELNGQRYSHTIDPRTARPITHNLASVTVIADSSAEADAYATAITVLGVKAGMAFAQKQGLAVYMISKTADGFTVSYSDEFEPYLSKASQ